MPDRQPKHILVVDDEAPVRTLLRDCFETEGYVVAEAADAAAAKAHISAAPPSLVTLDLKLGGDDGLVLAREIRAICNVPIVMISGKGDTIDRVVGLELGADDYISKPFHVREVLARVKAVLRRYETGTTALPGQLAPPPAAAGTTLTSSPVIGGAADERYELAGLVLDIPRRELRDSDGQIIELTTAEFNMLAMFAPRPHRVLSRDNIMDLLKGHEWSPFDRSIDSLVVRLRRKIEPSPDTPRIIKTVRGVGYVLASDVKRL
ncbi:MAG TPA: response regulator [Hyphomicrobiaceae bacterium]|nr:response regulator [Hyphomicrobiaceae bacterium]